MLWSDFYFLLFNFFFIKHFKIMATAMIPIHTKEVIKATPVLLKESQLPALSLHTSQKKEQDEQLYPSANSPILQMHWLLLYSLVHLQEPSIIYEKGGQWAIFQYLINCLFEEYARIWFPYEAIITYLRSHSWQENVCNSSYVLEDLALCKIFIEFLLDNMENFVSWERIKLLYFP